MSDHQDEVWEDLVRRLEATDSGRTEAEEPGPTTPGTPGDEPPRAVAGFDFRVDPALGAPAGHHAVGPWGPRDGAGPRDWVAAEAKEDFEPAEPAPLLAGRPDRVVAWLAGIFLPLALVVLALFWRSATPPLLWPILGVGTLASWAYLVWRMPTERRDDGDDGARV